MLLKSFMKVCTATQIYFIVWDESEWKDPAADSLDSFTLDYCAPMRSKEFEVPFWHYEALKEVGAKVKHVGVWTKEKLHLNVVVKSAALYYDTLDKKLAENGLKDYLYIFRKGAGGSIYGERACEK